MRAIAFSNNDIALVAWTYDRHLDGCLGFAIHQIDSAGKETVLPALARFAGQNKDATLTTEQAPVQKFWWKDLYAKRGGTYTYRIVPMGGTPGGTLTPLAGVDPIISNAVTLTENRPPFKAYFNRGIVATQALSHELNDHPSIDALQPHILDPADPIRIKLMGQLFEGVTSLLDRADSNGGTINAALYELNDPKGLEPRLQAADRGNPKSRSVILGNEQTVDPKTQKAIEDADADNRAALKAAKVTVIDRILGKGSIPHNKFMVLSEKGSPVAVLSGSTNWTSTGLCTQTNNALVTESADLGRRYLEYWNRLQADVKAAGGDEKKLQSPALRGFTHENNAQSIAKPVDLGGGVTIEAMFSPNTNHPLRTPPAEVPNDMKRVFDLIAGAKRAVLFLAFDPGNNSILDAAGHALARNPDLFVRGALTSPQRAINFSEALHQGTGADARHDGGGKRPAQARVTVVGESGTPRKKGEKSPPMKPDARVVPAGAITPNDAFGKWEAELAKFGFAIIHNKIVVIDPFSDDCVVVTGSHNLGYRASHNNDENMLIIRGHRALAEAYACHVLDLYDHYAWRFLLKQHPEIFGKPLEPDDTWQERYIVGADAKSPELRFWLSATNGGDSSSPGTPPRRPAAHRVTATPPPRKPATKKKATTARRKAAKPATTRKKTTAAKKKTTAQKKKTGARKR